MAVGQRIGALAAAGAFALGLLFVQLAAEQPAAAQSAAAAAAAAANPEYQALFKRMYADPSNLDVTFKFAELATKLGDYEAAIGALERMLYFNPNLPRVKLELGVLYHRIGGLKIAKSYFEQALATPGVPPDVVQHVNEFMQNIDTRLSPHKYGGFLHAGWRHQSNASAGPNDLTVQALGNPATLNAKNAAAPDWNKFVTGGAFYTYEFSDTLWLETNLVGYYAKQDRLRQFDLGIAEVQAGPRFAVPLINGSMRVYAIGTKAILAEDPYYQGPGAGVSSRFAIGNVARFEPSYEYRDRQYKNSVDYPLAAQLTGKLHTLATTAEGTLFGALPWAARLAADWNRTVKTLPTVAVAVPSSNDEFNSYDRLAADIAFPIPFVIPWFDEKKQAVFTPGAGVSRTRYLEPDALINETIARLDREWHVSGSLDVQIYDRFGLRTQVYYTKTHSSLPNFESKNIAISFGPTARF